MAADLQTETRAGESMAAINSLGVLYAKYGQVERAEAVFRWVSAQEPYLPSMLNLGHLYFAQGNCEEALSIYRQADKLEPGRPRTLLALARASQGLERCEDRMLNYEKLKVVDPALAERFAFLGDGEEQGSHASDVATQRMAILWESGS